MSNASGTGNKKNPVGNFFSVLGNGIKDIGVTFVSFVSRYGLWSDNERTVLTRWNVPCS